jgi:hypothetical protein
MYLDIYDVLGFYSGIECLSFLGCYAAKIGEFSATIRKSALSPLLRQHPKNLLCLTLKMDTTSF